MSASKQNPKTRQSPSHSGLQQFPTGDSKQTYLALHAENQLLIEHNIELSEQNNLLELEIQSKQQNDMHAEKFAREQLNLIYKDEDFLSFETKKPNAPQ